MEDADIVKQQVKEGLASSPASTNRETDSESVEDVEEPDTKSSILAEESAAPLPGGSSPPDDDTTLDVKKDSTPPPLQAEEGSGDCRRDTPRNEEASVTAEEISKEYSSGEQKGPEATTPPTLDDRKDDYVDGPDAEESAAPEDSTPLQAEEGNRDCRRDTPRNEEASVTAEEISDDRSDLENQEKDTHENTPVQATAAEVETLGPTTQETADAQPAVPAVIANQGGSRIFLIAVGILGLVLAIFWQNLFLSEPPPQKDDVPQIDIFLRQLEKVKTEFPNQRAELWSRSKIHLLRHLQTAQPTEPVSLILTAGHGGERTLQCLAQSLAAAFSSSLNASVLHIDGVGNARQDSDQVKLDIDSKLQGAFEGDQPVAVINRFEELPPGSTLIFYRYCDHENAAYKKSCLIFTVLLGDEEEIPAETRLSTVEEMVDDYLKKKFLSKGHPVSFDRMDLDKYGGLWSRISHLILPVAAEERLEREGCSGM